MVFPTFFNLSLNLATRTSWSEPQSAPNFCWLCRTSPSSDAKNIINLISVLTIWWCPRAESSLVLSEEGVCYDQCVLLGNSVSPCLASFCPPRPNLLVTPGISWLHTFASSMMKRTYYFGVSSRRSYRSSLNHSTSASSALEVGG